MGFNFGGVCTPGNSRLQFGFPNKDHRVLKKTFTDLVTTNPGAF
jgi:hypothetical protein